MATIGAGPGTVLGQQPGTAGSSPGVEGPVAAPPKLSVRSTPVAASGPDSAELLAPGALPSEPWMEEAGERGVTPTGSPELSASPADSHRPSAPWLLGVAHSVTSSH